MVAVLFVLQASLSTRLDRWVHPEPFTAVVTQKMDPRVSSAMRALAFLSGYKVLVGHIFWVQVALYYGDTDNAKDRYAKLYDFCSLASDLNPQLEGIYTFGASVLAFHVKRPEEAFRLLEKGIRANPTDQGLKLLYAAILYENAGQYDKVIPFLESQLLRPDAPTSLANILANSYKKAGRYGDSIKLWRRILAQTESDEVRVEAAKNLQELYAITKARK